MIRSEFDQLLVEVLRPFKFASILLDAVGLHCSMVEVGLNGIPGIVHDWRAPSPFGTGAFTPSYFFFSSSSSFFFLLLRMMNMKKKSKIKIVGIPIIRLQSVLLTTPGCTTSRLIDD